MDLLLDNGRHGVGIEYCTIHVDHMLCTVFSVTQDPDCCLVRRTQALWHTRLALAEDTQ